MASPATAVKGGANVSRRLRWLARMRAWRVRAHMRAEEEERAKVRAQRGFLTVGEKELYIPNHIITFLRPKPNQSPTTATFEVPLTFNKFDLRDYLWHLYHVGTNSVRSFVIQPRPQQRNLPGKYNGAWYRPRAQKLMIVDLKKPFTWPERPTDPKELEPWDNKLYTAVEDGHEHQIKENTERQQGMPKLREEKATAVDRKKLGNLAKEILAGKKAWVPEKGWVEGSRNVRKLREEKLKT